MTGSAPRSGPRDLEALARQAATYATENSVSPKTAAMYDYLFKGHWSDLCDKHGVGPHEAPASMIETLYEAAAAGAFRRPGRGNTRTGPVSPSLVDSILAAVKHTYTAAGEKPPQDHLPAGHLTDRRAQYRRLYANTHVRGNGPDAAPDMPADLYGTLCRTALLQGNAEWSTGVAALLSLDFELTVSELASLNASHAHPMNGGCAVVLADRTVEVLCRHNTTHGVFVPCVGCALPNMARADAGGGPLLAPSNNATSAGRAQASLTARFSKIAHRWPTVTASGSGKTFRLVFEDDVDGDAKAVTRLGVLLVSTQLAYLMLTALTAAKLAACTGVTVDELFNRLDFGDVVITSREDGRPRVSLLLRYTARSANPAKTAFEVLPQDDRDLCAAAALVQWITLREAMYGGPLPAETPLFGVSRQWWAPGQGRMNTQVATQHLRSLVERAGLEPVYHYASLAGLYQATLVAAGVDEAQFLRAVRLKKPEHGQRARSRYQPRPDHAVRRVADA